MEIARGLVLNHPHSACVVALKRLCHEKAVVRIVAFKFLRAELVKIFCHAADYEWIFFLLVCVQEVVRQVPTQSTVVVLQLWLLLVLDFQHIESVRGLLLAVILALCYKVLVLIGSIAIDFGRHICYLKLGLQIFKRSNALIKQFELDDDILKVVFEEDYLAELLEAWLKFLNRPLVSNSDYLAYFYSVVNLEQIAILILIFK